MVGDKLVSGTGRRLDWVVISWAFSAMGKPLVLMVASWAVFTSDDALDFAKNCCVTPASWGIRLLFLLVLDWFSVILLWLEDFFTQLILFTVRQFFTVPSKNFRFQFWNSSCSARLACGTCSGLKLAGWKIFFLLVIFSAKGGSLWTGRVDNPSCSKCLLRATDIFEGSTLRDFPKHLWGLPLYLRDFPFCGNALWRSLFNLGRLGNKRSWW